MAKGKNIHSSADGLLWLSWNAIVAVTGGGLGKTMHRQSSLLGDPVLSVVVGDFGRDAGIRFCSLLSLLERNLIRDRLSEDALFYDEYRRISLTLVGDLRFVKAPQLEAFRRRGGSLDRRILVGFPGGLSPDEVAPRLGALALEAMKGPVLRGIEKVLVLLPCNTLAPASWLLDDYFKRAETILEMAEEGGLSLSSELEVLAATVEENVRVLFPTVPEAVLKKVVQLGGDSILVIGTEGIVDVYETASSRMGSSVEPITLLPDWQRAAFEAIEASISGETRRCQRAHESLKKVAREAAERHPALVVVEACTDLDYGVGIDSTSAYAEAVVETVYSI